MDKKIFIPQVIKVGFNPRNDTYTGKLAYVIYYDTKGVLRKEKSWDTWINNGYRSTRYVMDENNRPMIKDGRYVTEVDPDVEAKRNDRPEFKNEPTEGFVLNKKAGGDRYGWNPRQTYCRVYDPRGFEFEITIPNLLYILENTNSIVGKGLEGKFVYGWQGKDLVLIPEKSPEYEDMMNFSKIQAKKITKKELVSGHTYLTKKLEELIYLGYFMTHTVKISYVYDHTKGYPYNRKEQRKLIKRKKHWFYNLKKGMFLHRSDYKNLSEIADDNVSSEYARIMQNLEHHSEYSPEDESKTKYEKTSLDDKSLIKYGYFACDGLAIKISKDKYYNLKSGDIYRDSATKKPMVNEQLAKRFNLDTSGYNNYAGYAQRLGIGTKKGKVLSLQELLNQFDGCIYKKIPVLSNNKIKKY
jgi:hypothetical protein